MSLEQLMGRYFRLKQELEIAYSAQSWNGALIDRLANDLAAAEAAIAAWQQGQRREAEALALRQKEPLDVRTGRQGHMAAALCRRTSPHSAGSDRSRRSADRADDLSRRGPPGA